MRSAPYERGKLNKPGLSGVHWHPKDVGLIVETAQSIPPEEWLYAGTAWLREPRRESVATGFCGAEIACDNPTELANLWARGLGASLGADGVSVLLGEFSLSSTNQSQQQPMRCCCMDVKLHPDFML